MRIYGFGAVKSTQVDEHSLYLKNANDLTVRITVLEDDIIRVTMLPDGAYRLRRTWMVVDESGDVPLAGRDRDDLAPFSRPTFEHKVQESRVTIKTQSLSVIAILDDLRLEWKNAAGREFAEDAISRAYAHNPSGREIYHYMNRRPDDHYYGFGEKAGPLDKVKHRMEMRGVDALGYDAERSDPLYKHWPFYITLVPDLNVAYGLFYDNLSTCVFDMGRERHAYYNFYRYYQADDGDLDYYLIYGPTIAEVLEKFTKLSGRMQTLPPRWSLGYLGSTMTYTEMPDAQAQLQSFIDQCAEHDIPCDLFHLSSGYTTDPENHKRYVFHWNTARIPDPQAMVQAFHKANIQLCANVKPYLIESHPQYEAVKSQGGFIQSADADGPATMLLWAGGLQTKEPGGHLDFTNPLAFNWWKEQATNRLLDYGIDSIWNDNNEYGIWDDEARCKGFGDTIRLGMIRPLHNLLMTRASYEAQREKRPDERPFVLTRSAIPGSQRYAQTWSGDNDTSWHTLQYNIPMGLGSNLSGLSSTGHDVGGFFGPKPSAELFVRWLQNGIFHPRFTIHSLNNDFSVTEPWMYPDIVPLVRETIKFRYQLIPYLYALFVAYMQAGAPIIRPMVYEFQADANTHQNSFDFLLGSHLLVASVIEAGVRTRELYLPEGTNWCDFHTGTWHKGGQHITVDAPLERVPLLVRENGIIPLTRQDDADTRRLLLFPAQEGENTFVLYEDDGVSLAYQRGEQTQVICHLQAAPDTIHLHITIEGQYALPYDRVDVILPPGEKRSLSVEVVGAALGIVRG